MLDRVRLRVIATAQGFDFAGATGKLIASVLLACGEMERENIRERQAAGIAVAKKRGKYQGRRAGTTSADPNRAHELRRQGLTRPEIAKALGVSPRTAARYLAAAK